MRELKISLGENSYSILIEKGLISSIGKKISEIYNGKKVAVVTDKNVDKFYGDKIVSQLEGRGFNVKK